MTSFHAFERAIRASLREGDTPGAVRAALDVYGPEIFGFLCGVLVDPDSAARLYADVVQRITTEVEEFQWRCSLRTWMYWIARRELQDRRHRGVSNRPPSTEQPPPVATESRRLIGTVALRGRLKEEDREILILRVDRRFGWRELAITGLGDGAAAPDVARESLRLRDRVDAIVREIHEGAPKGHPG
jgi:DNA-directed RNA polymerase specialized sigma24 family protein